MIIDDFDLKSILLPPSEAYSPLITDANAVLPLALSLKCFQTIPWGNGQIV